MNQTIYIQKQVWEEFSKEPNKSALVNELLKKQYGLGVMINVQLNKEGNIEPRRIDMPAEVQMPKLDTPYDRYKYDPTINQYFDTETASYVGKKKPI